MEVTERERQICTFCMVERFTEANPERTLFSATDVQPEGVWAQHALWQYDKGGTLQDLLHKLKYEHLARVGVQLGRRLGQSVREHGTIYQMIDDGRPGVILVPVPLHYLKQVKRGFNQAFMIARGVSEVLDIPICDIKDVVRRRNTRSQTGFSLEQRQNNIRGAFRVNNPGAVAEKLAVVVDDVFTTGATSFELAGELTGAGALGVIILTVAQA
ncbi:MAG: ComF family protein [Balneolaceae bacterium]|nr:ComF family protein [Balneolaceae bacterium]